MSLTKAKIVERIYTNSYFSKREATKLLETMFDIVKENLCSGQELKILGLGQFLVKDKNSRMGRNPQSGDKIEIQPRKVITFKLSKVLREDIIDLYAHRIDKNGDEDLSIPPREKTRRALNYFITNTKKPTGA